MMGFFRLKCSRQIISFSAGWKKACLMFLQGRRQTCQDQQGSCRHRPGEAAIILQHLEPTYACTWTHYLDCAVPHSRLSVVATVQGAKHHALLLLECSSWPC